MTGSVRNYVGSATSVEVGAVPRSPGHSHHLERDWHIAIQANARPDAPLRANGTNSEANLYKCYLFCRFFVGVHCDANAA